MFQINQGKHVVEEIDGVRCTIIETGATEERVKFLKDLLEFNKFEVKIVETPSVASLQTTKTYTIGVTDIVFFPTVAIYERSLHTRQGHHVTPAYWKQYSDICDPRYWRKTGKLSGAKS
jgi:hypothetical protein